MAEQGLAGLEQLHPAHLRQMMRSRDIAYACFAYLGLLLLLAFIYNHLPSSWLLYRAGATVLSLPVTFASLLVAGLIGVAYAVRAWREWSLALLAVMTLLIPVMLYAATRSAAVKAWLGSLFFISYTLLALLLPLWWLLHRRTTWRQHLV